VVQNQKTGFAGPYDGDLHLLNHYDNLASILAVCTFSLGKIVDVEAGREQIGLRLDFDIGHDDQDGIAAEDEDPHDPVVILET
jgi:hypothetical protein